MVRRGASVFPDASVAGAETFECGPRSLGIHVIDGDGRDPAPVVDARVEERGEVVAQVGRRLDVHVGAEHDTRRRDGPHELVAIARRVVVHGGAGLGQEVLNDHLLHVPVTGVALANGEQGVDALGARLADPDEDPGGEGHACETRRFERRETAGRRLVGRAVVWAARLAQSFGQRLDHHSLRRAHGPEALELGL